MTDLQLFLGIRRSEPEPAPGSMSRFIENQAVEAFDSDPPLIDFSLFGRTVVWFYSRSRRCVNSPL